MKILLVRPPMKDFAPPLGIGYIGAVLAEHGYDVKAIDMFNFSWENVAKTIKKENPDIIGISCLTDSRGSAFRVVQVSKAINPAIRTVMGGPHSNTMYEQILLHLPIDIVVLGEGELTMLGLVRAWKKKQNISKVKGIAFKKDGEVFATEQRPFIKDLDTLPFPAYDFFSFDSYIPPIETRFSEYFFSNPKYSRRTGIVTSRGCPFRCRFCSSSSFWGHQWRPRSPANVVSEIELLKNKYKVRCFGFADDIFTVDGKRVIEICKVMIARKLNVAWNAETRVDLVSKEMLQWMKRAGCYQISFGIESGSSTILRTIDKGITASQIIHAFRIAREVGLETYALVMVGNPGESESTINQTKNLIDIIRPDFLRVTLATVYPGTVLYELAKSKGLICDNFWLSEKPSPVYTCEHTIEKLDQWRNKLVSSFRKPWDPKENIKNFFLRTVLRPKKAALFVERRIRELWQ